VPAKGQRLIVMAPTPPPVFGHSVLTLSVLASLRRLGLLAAHIDTRDDRSLDNLNRLDVENVRLGLLAAWRLIGEIRRNPGAGVYVQVSQGRWGFLRDALWIWIGAAAQRPVYVHLLGGRFHEFHQESGPFMRRLIRATIRRARACWVLTPSLRSCFDGIADPERVGVFGCTAEDPFAGRPPGERSGAEGLRVLFLSNLREGKGHDVLLAALSRLGGRAAGWQVRLVGEVDGAVARRVESWIEARPERALIVELAGARTGPAKADELAWADVFVFPTSYRNEGQPIVVLEAMAAGLAIVSTRHRGIPDTVREGEEALLADPGDVAGIADALATLSADPELRERLGRAARARYEERFVPERMDEQLGPLLGG
jgi:glycosyltransferase involved in cell wall biosynthesis